MKYELLSESLDRISIPSCEILPESKIDNLIQKLFTDHVDLDPWFTNFILSDVDIINSTLNINYFCFIPYSTKIKQSILIPITNNEIYSASIRKILAKI